MAERLPILPLEPGPMPLIILTSKPPLASPRPRSLNSQESTTASPLNSDLITSSQLSVITTHNAFVAQSRTPSWSLNDLSIALIIIGSLSLTVNLVGVFLYLRHRRKRAKDVKNLLSQAGISSSTIESDNHHSEGECDESPPTYDSAGDRSPQQPMHGTDSYQNPRISITSLLPRPDERLSDLISASTRFSNTDHHTVILDDSSSSDPAPAVNDIIDICRRVSEPSANQHQNSVAGQVQPPLDCRDDRPLSRSSYNTRPPSYRTRASSDGLRSYHAY